MQSENVSRGIAPMRESCIADRRKYLRIPMRQVLSISRSDAKPLPALGTDLSIAGIRFEVVGCEIELADMLTVHFQHHDQELRALGRVVWCTELDPVVHEVGMEFLEVPPDTAKWLVTLVDEPSPSD